MLFLLLMGILFPPEKDICLKVMTYNIRLDIAVDSINQWPFRKEKVASLLNKEDPDIFGVQEALHGQMEDLEFGAPAYRWFGVGRNDGKTSGEYAAIFYKEKKFKLTGSGTFWLSETPEVPGSKSWDAAITRICTWISLQDKKSGKSFFVFNTHFDHKGEQARLESMKLISEKINQLAGGLPFVLLGDFNFEPSDAPYQVVNDSRHWKIKDTYLAAGKNTSKRPCTYTGFQIGGSVCKRIDYIFVPENTRVKSVQIIDSNDGAHYPSDHLPVMATLKF